ncbi:MAG: hypothetical protein ISS23_03280 [Nanoarchaeota archaeon]|nr:hypothetical protein [Nanoarchaeota archaeon]
MDLKEFKSKLPKNKEDVIVRWNVFFDVVSLRTIIIALILLFSSILVAGRLRLVYAPYFLILFCVLCSVSLYRNKEGGKRTVAGFCLIFIGIYLLIRLFFYLFKNYY